MSDEVKMPEHGHSMSPQDCVLLLQQEIQKQAAELSRLRAENESLKRQVAEWELIADDNVRLNHILEADLAVARKTIERVIQILKKWDDVGGTQTALVIDIKKVVGAP